jgi:integrase
VGEAVALDWRDVSLATGTLTVGRAKTDAGSWREVDLPAGLVEVLNEWEGSSTRRREGSGVRHPRRQAAADHGRRAAAQGRDQKSQRWA